METFTVVREVDLSPQDAWDRVTDWERHGDHVPLTRIRRTGDGFVARTGAGPLGFDDPMKVVEFEPPRRCRIVKTGRVVTGDITIEIEPHGSGSRIVWTESVGVIGAPKFAGPLVNRSGRWLFGRILDGVLQA